MRSIYFTAGIFLSLFIAGCNNQKTASNESSLEKRDSLFLGFYSGISIEEYDALEKEYLKAGILHERPYIDSGWLYYDFHLDTLGNTIMGQLQFFRQKKIYLNLLSPYFIKVNNTFESNKEVRQKLVAYELNRLSPLLSLYSDKYGQPYYDSSCEYYNRIFFDRNRCIRFEFPIFAYDEDNAGIFKKYKYANFTGDALSCEPIIIFLPESKIEYFDRIRSKSLMKQETVRKDSLGKQEYQIQKQVEYKRTITNI